jgi:hypothetical protein
MTDTTDTTKAKADAPITDLEIAALLPEPDGSAEANKVRCEVAPGIFGYEYEEVDAWSFPLIANAIRAAIERAVAAERKRCKDLCEAISDQYREREGLRYPELRSDAETGAGECAAAIEALDTTGEQP